MDDELDQAARRQREKKRLGNLLAQQRMREEAQRKAEASHLSTPSAPSVPENAEMRELKGGAIPESAQGASSSSSTTPAAQSASNNGTSAKEFKQAVAAKFQELVASGMSRTDAAKDAIRLTKEAGLTPLAAQAATSSSSASSGVPPAQKVPKVSHTGADAQPVDNDEEIICPGGPFTCFICVEEKGSLDRFLPHKCSLLPEAMCCKACYIAWVESQIDAEAAVIKCCHCDLLLQPATLAKLVDAQHWAQYCESALQRNLKRDASFIWCSKCSGGGWLDPQQPSSKCAWVCPECASSFQYCPYCRRDHGSLSCKRYQTLRSEVLEGQARKDRESEGAVQRSSKMCPSCKMPIQKAGGCNFMDCPNCRRHFCWSCGRILKGSHQRHHCDAGFEVSDVVHRAPGGTLCVEFTRLFTNVIDIDKVELLNTEQGDLAELKDMLAPGLASGNRFPLFVGPSTCDGEVALLIPFNFQKAMAWELTHIQVRASHPPAAGVHPPRSMALLPNVTSASFSDYDDPTTPTLALQDRGKGVLVASLEHFRVKGTFRRVTSMGIRLSVAAVGEELEDPLGEVFFNDIALFGVPSQLGASKGSMWDDRANLIVSPTIHRRRWGEEIAEGDSDKEMGNDRDEGDEQQAAEEEPPAPTAEETNRPATASSGRLVEAFPRMEEAHQPVRFGGFGPFGGRPRQRAHEHRAHRQRQEPEEQGAQPMEEGDGEGGIDAEEEG